MLALKGLTPSGQLPLGVLSQGKSGLSSGQSEMTVMDIVQRKQSLNALISWVFVGEQVHACDPCNTI